MATRKATAKKKKQPTIDSANVKERNSRNSFELQVSPWVCVPSSGATDHGHDYTVEIVSPKEDLTNYTADGRFFLVQLKSQSTLSKNVDFVTPHPIETAHILQWYRSSAQLPFLFVVNDLQSNQFYYTWIDGILISGLEKLNPYWSRQEKITLKIPIDNVLIKGENPKLREYVYNHNYSALTHLEPGIFFSIKENTTKAISSYAQLISNSPFDSTKADAAKLKLDSENAAYRVAITGLSRVGKSSLINALLKRPDISPTNVWQTTGVPIVIQPSKNERVVVAFHDRPAETHPYSEQIIKQYATRELNEENHKRVKDVNVFITSSQLERGVMFYDIPGLDDPNDEIMAFAHHTAECANVVLYLIDGSSARSGGFVFKNDYKKDLEAFARSSREKIFLVITKIDELSLSQLQELKKEILRNLKKYNLLEKIVSKIYYVAIDPPPTNIPNLVILEPEINSVTELDNDLWTFMLRENKVGLIKLYSLIKDLHASMQNLQRIIKAGSLNAQSKQHLTTTINSVKQKIRSLESHIYERNDEIYETVKKNLEIRRTKIVEHLKNQLLNQEDLPPDATIKNYLSRKGYDAVMKTQEDMSLQLIRLRDYIDNWTKENLGPVQDIINIQSAQVTDSLSEINEMQFPAVDLSSVWGKSILITIATVALTALPGVSFIIGAGSFIADLIWGKNDRHAKRVRKLIDKVDGLYSKAFADTEFQLKAKLDEQVDDLVSYINRRLNLYFSDLEQQINNIKLDSNFDYQGFEKQAEMQLPAIQKEISTVWDELQKHLAATRLLEQ